MTEGEPLQYSPNQIRWEKLTRRWKPIDIQDDRKSIRGSYMICRTTSPVYTRLYIPVYDYYESVVRLEWPSLVRESTYVSCIDVDSRRLIKKFWSTARFHDGHLPVCNSRNANVSRAHKANYNYSIFLFVYSNNRRSAATAPDTLVQRGRAVSTDTRSATYIDDESGGGCNYDLH